MGALAPLQNASLDRFSRVAGVAGLLEVVQSSVEIGKLTLRERMLALLQRDAIPQILDERDLLGNAQLVQIDAGEIISHGASFFWGEQTKVYAQPFAGFQPEIRTASATRIVPS